MPKPHPSSTADDAGADALLVRLRAFGLAYPGAHTKSPWPGHLDLAVNDKTFAYLSIEGAPFSISCKLPHSAHVALMLPHTAPTGYGLGKSGWVSASPPQGTAIDVEMLEAWIDESYRAQAPKRLVAQLAARPAADSPATKAPTTKAPATKAPAKKAPAKKAPVKKAPAEKRPARKTAAAKDAARRPPPRKSAGR